MRLVRGRSENADEVELFFSRLHSIIPAQRKELPMQILDNNSVQFQERRKNNPMK
jgi:hypothetical protein